MDKRFSTIITSFLPFFFSPTVNHAKGNFFLHECSHNHSNFLIQKMLSPLPFTEPHFQTSLPTARSIWTSLWHRLWAMIKQAWEGRKEGRKAPSKAATTGSCSVREGCLEQVYWSPALWGCRPASTISHNQLSASPVTITFLTWQRPPVMASSGENKMGFKLTTQANRQ